MPKFASLSSRVSSEWVARQVIDIGMNKGLDLPCRCDDLRLDDGVKKVPWDFSMNQSPTIQEERVNGRKEEISNDLTCMLKSVIGSMQRVCLWLHFFVVKL